MYQPTIAPGHSKSILTTYLTGSSGGMGGGLMMSLARSLTHVTMAVVIAWFSLPLVSRILGSERDVPTPEILSRGLLGLIAPWMPWSAFFRAHHAPWRNGGLAVDMMAGLIQRPLTRLVTTFAMARGVPVAGVLMPQS